MDLDQLLVALGITAVVMAGIVLLAWRGLLPRSILKRIIMTVVGLVAGLALVFALVGLIPTQAQGFEAHPAPVADYATAIARIETLQQAETARGVTTECHSRLLTHGARVEKAIVLVHGLTNCPRQMAQLADEFYQYGYNVLIVGLPHHGEAIYTSDAVKDLTAEELRNYSDTVVDIGQGLGNKVYILGHSIGGNVTAWVGQYRSDVERAVAVSPALGLPFVPHLLARGVTNSLLWLPNVNVGLNPPPPGMTIFPTHAVAQTWRFGDMVMQAAERQPPQARSIVVVPNLNDTSTSAQLTTALAQAWQAHGGSVTLYPLPYRLHLTHDLIEPTHPRQNIRLVYPMLIDLVEGRLPEE